MTFEQRFNLIAGLIDAADGLVGAYQGCGRVPVQVLLKAALDEGPGGSEFAAQAAETARVQGMNAMHRGSDARAVLPRRPTDWRAVWPLAVLPYRQLADDLRAYGWTINANIEAWAAAARDAMSAPRQGCPGEARSSFLWTCIAGAVLGFSRQEVAR